MDRKIVISECQDAVQGIRQFLSTKGESKDEIKEATKHYYRTYKRGMLRGAELQRKIDIAKLKEAMNRLMLDTHDKAEIIKAMEE